MARLPRLTLPGHPHHVIHRGHNRQPVFIDSADYTLMHGLLVEQSRIDGVAVHAYVLMENHLHLLATPAEADSLARMMQGIGRRYGRHFNARTQRSGTLWEGRYRCAPLQAQPYLIAAMVHMDLHPVRAGLVENPADYAWSSHRHYTGRVNDRLISVHPLFWSLGNTPFAREQAYAQRVADGLPTAVQQVLSESALYGWALGDEDFLAELQKATGRRLSRGKPGRPRNAAPN